MEVPSSLATNLNTMTQGNLDHLREAYSFPLGLNKDPREWRDDLVAGGARTRSRIKVGMALLQGEARQKYFEGGPNNIKGWKKRFFFILRHDWEFHPSIPHEERAVRVPRSWGAPCWRKRHFKILAFLDSRTFHKYFVPNQVEMSSSGSDTVEGDAGGRATASAGDESESRYSRDVPYPNVLSRDDLVDFIGIIKKENKKGPTPCFRLIKMVRGKV
ncbi:hypothetical protein Acr_16g0000310 [Actinidia rufa]|uniref:Uncharacterized protein n=1 Tax=Actinidia rufa TaxID=165716 RepID=A0A7J0FY58_9ERIC|nr:hypothetical protein Acr_16g0000310 [Actinidia rufa]